MKHYFRKMGVLMMGLVFCGAGLGRAEQPVDVAKLQTQVENLTQQVIALQHQVETLRDGKEKVPNYIVPAGGPEKPGGLLRAVEDIHVGGYIDTQFDQNFSKETTNAGGNTLRVFDRNQDSFTLNQAKIYFEKKANPEGGAGFRLDMLMGEDARVIDAGSGVDRVLSFEQAYAEVVAPLNFFKDSRILPHSVNLKAGRFVTLAGAEVIDSPGNWNISRSFMFGYAIPFTHTGLRSNFGLFNDFLSVTLGINNGWDNGIDNNQWKTTEGAVSFSPIKNVTVISSLYFGPENARQAGHKRYLSSNVITWDVTPKFSLMGDLDFGTERRVPGLDGKDFKDALWHGYAGYAKYKLTDKLAGVYRIELFRDQDLFRTGLDGELWGQTFTLEYKVFRDLIARLEYRLDRSNDAEIFNGRASQSTVGGQLIYNFG